MNLDLFMWLCYDDSGMIIQVMGGLQGRYDLLWRLICVNLFLKNDVYVYNVALVFFQQPSEQNTYSDIEAVYRCLEEKYGVKEQDVILYGQSVGSGPTLELASRLPNLRAVVLHSAIASGLRVMYPVKRTYWFDIYKVILQTFICFFSPDFRHYFCSNLFLHL